MSRNQIVLLVSRALAVIQAVSALFYVTSVPEYLYSLNHYGSVPGYIGTIHRIEALALLIRIVGFSILAWLFWRCGPWVSGILFPVREAEPVQAK